MTSAKKLNVNKVHADTLNSYADHFLGYFTDDSVTRAGLTIGNTWIESAITMPNIDITSNVTLKANAGRYRVETNYFELGRYDETTGWANAENANLKNTTDADLLELYDDIKDVLTWNYLNAIITTDYISNIQDIEVFWSGAGAGYANIVYQLEGQPWKILQRDDGYDSYSSTNQFGNGVANDILCYAAFAGKYDGTSEPEMNKPFFKDLYGKTAKIGFVYGAGRGPNNNIRLSSIMVNRANSIKALVDAVETEVILKERWWIYNPLVKIAGYKILPSQVMRLDLANFNSENTYYEKFASYYLEVMSEELAVKPAESYVVNYVWSDTQAFAYDHNAHTPSCIITLNDLPATDIVKYNYHYTCNEVNIGTEAPTEINWYSMVIEVENTDKYEANSSWLVFHIDDSAEAFVRDWRALRSSVDGNMCYFVNAETEKLQSLIDRYNALGDGKEAVAAQLEDDGETSIADSVAYFESLLVAKENAGTEASSLGMLVANNSNNNIIVSCIVLMSIMTIAYIIIKKKKFAK